MLQSLGPREGEVRAAGLSWPVRTLVFRALGEVSSREEAAPIVGQELCPPGAMATSPRVEGSAPEGTAAQRQTLV